MVLSSPLGFFSLRSRTNASSRPPHQSEPLAVKLVEVKVGKAKAEDPARAPGAAAHIFKEFFAALVKGRGRYF